MCVRLWSAKRRGCERIWKRVACLLGGRCGSYYYDYRTPAESMLPCQCRTFKFLGARDLSGSTEKLWADLHRALYMRLLQLGRSTKSHMHFEVTIAMSVLKRNIDLIQIPGFNCPRPSCCATGESRSLASMYLPGLTRATRHSEIAASHRNSIDSLHHLSQLILSHACEANNVDMVVRVPAAYVKVGYWQIYWNME